MKPFAEEVREILSTKIYCENCGNMSVEGEKEATLSICEAVRRRVEGLKYKRDWEDEPIGSYSGYKKAIEDILKEMG
jgi:hypothetical protein